MKNAFSSPIGESTFSTSALLHKDHLHRCFRPLSGNLLSLLEMDCAKIYPTKRFRPLSGNLLSLPYICIALRSLALLCFRPLSGNLLSLRMVNLLELRIIAKFSSPIGESTFSTSFTEKRLNINYIRFSSPIGESTFSTVYSLYLV